MGKLEADQSISFQTLNDKLAEMIASSRQIRRWRLWSASPGGGGGPATRPIGPGLRGAEAAVAT